MANLCKGVIREPESGAFFYEDNSLRQIHVPVGNCKGTYVLTPAELNKYFGVEPWRMGTLPEYLIAPHLNSTRNVDRSKSTGRAWWDITGEVVAYRPIEWVPIVNELRTIPLSQYKTESTKTITDVTTSKLYGPVDASFNLAGGGGWLGMKIEPVASTTTTTVKASYRSTKKLEGEIVDKAEFRGAVIKELVMGLGLRVERVFERTVKLFLNDEKKPDSLNWEGREKWTDILVPARALRDVKSLQFHPIVMTGSGHSGSLWIQALPVFDKTTKKLTDMHLLLSNAGWPDWYVYNGKKIFDSGRVETLPVPGGAWPPVVTFFPVGPSV